MAIVEVLWYKNKSRAMKPAQGHHACATNVAGGGEDMKTKMMGAITLAVLLLLVFAVVAQAAVPQSTVDLIIQDAKDGFIDGNWTATEIGAALMFAENDPIISQYYSGIMGVLEDYLASLQAPGEKPGAQGGQLAAQGGQLAFTGGEIILILSAGAGLIGSGALLRRRRD